MHSKAVKPTPTPWHLSERGFSSKGLWSAPTVYAADDALRYIAVCACADFNNEVHSATDNLANAALIVTAVNSHAAYAEVVRAAEELIAFRRDIIQFAKAWDNLRAALAAARGQQTGE